ncbi:MAG: hypothetical protein QF754_08825 [Alphaproteobacteria bacterium]|jgi:Asp-tRNA(Asn)/Glu-tRNA(Gln) amidotransferase A subunit family amidase|nr:hypothetical protein [Alphaproteobacteria bacterium]
MTEADLVHLDIAALAGLISTREVSPVEVATIYLERIERLDPHLGAFIPHFPDELVNRCPEMEIML